jgi:hypothetical protein
MYLKQGDRVIAYRDGRDYPMGRTDWDVFTYKEGDTGIVLKVSNTVAGVSYGIEFDNGTIIMNCNVESFKKFQGNALTDDELNQTRSWGVRKSS